MEEPQRNITGAPNQNSVQSSLLKNAATMLCLLCNCPRGSKHEVCKHQHRTQNNQGTCNSDALQVWPAKIDRCDSAGQNDRPANPDNNVGERNPARIEGGVKPIENPDKEE